MCKGVTVNPPRIEKPKMNKAGGPGVKTPEVLPPALPLRIDCCTDVLRAFRFLALLLIRLGVPKQLRGWA